MYETGRNIFSLVFWQGGETTEVIYYHNVIGVVKPAVQHYQAER